MKFFGIIVLLAVAACSNGEHRALSKSTISRSALTDLVEDLREVLRTGNEELGIPVCEPLELDSVNFAIEESVASLTGKFTDLHVAGLTDFTIDTLTFSVIGVRFTFGFTWPTVTYDTGYTLDGIAGGVVPVYGDGKIQGSLTNLRVTGVAALSVRNSYLYIRSLTTDIRLGALDFKITGLLNDDDLSALVSALVSDLVPGLIDDYQTEITDVVNAEIIKHADEILGTMTLAELLALILG